MSRKHPKGSRTVAEIQEMMAACESREHDWLQHMRNALRGIQGERSCWKRLYRMLKEAERLEIDKARYRRRLKHQDEEE